MRFCIKTSMILHIFSVLFTYNVFVSSAGLKELFSWTRISYQGLEARYMDVSTSIIFEGLTNQDKNIIPTREVNYIYQNNVPMGANVWKDKLFITVPRRRLGVPSTLNYVPLNSKNKRNTPLIPYPDWSSNLYPDPDGGHDNFVSVYRIAIDPCDRMWFVDTGVVEVLGNRTVVKPHTLVAIDLNTDTELLRYEIPQNVISRNPGLASLVVDVTAEECDDAFVYIPDLSGYCVLVYSQRLDKAWRVNHNYFYLESIAGEFSIAGYDFQWNDGVFSLELSDIKNDGFRDLYFHSMAGTHMFKVSTAIMKNESLATRSYHGNDFTIVGDRGPKSHTSQADIHKRSGVMFLNLVNQNAIGCWDTKKPLNSISVVKKDDAKMIYPSDIKIYNDSLYVLTNTMPEFLYGQLDYDRVNFRIWTNTISAAIQGTKCENKRLI